MFDAPTKEKASGDSGRVFSNLMRAFKPFKPGLSKSRAISLVLAASMVASCQSTSGVKFGTTGFVPGFFGGLAVDEPRAALVGRDILTSGGSAADAAVAIGFALSVTYPSAISLGGGGVCLVHDSKLGLTEVLDFVPPAGTGAQGDRPTALPTLTRGMAALHARYGRFPWRAVVTPAEKLARLGHKVSRAFAVELNRAAPALYQEPSVREVFVQNDRLVGEGEELVQADLAGVLGQIRAGGGGAFYSGQLGRRVAEGVQAAGGTLTYEELTAYTPEWRFPIIVPYGDDEIYFSPPPAGAGPMLAVMMQLLSENDRYAEATAEERNHLLAEIMKRASADRKNWMGTDFQATAAIEEIVDPARIGGLMASYNPSRATPGAELEPEGRQFIEVISGTGFVVLDQTGMAVACNLTLYNPFGTGRIAGDTGILLGAAPGLRGRNPLGLGPVIAVNPHTLAFKFAAASGGGPLAPAAIGQIMAEVLLAGNGLRDTVAAPRFLAVDAPDTVLVEKEGGDDLAAELTARSHPVSQLSWQGKMNAIYCPRGLSENSEGANLCEVANDPRGFGLGPVSQSEQ